MKRVHCDSINEVPVLSKRSVVTLGVFDGMHQGHLRVLDVTCATSKRLNADTVVVTFGAHPETLINGRPPEMIISLEHRLRLFERAGIDLAVIIPFNEKTRNTAAERFLTDFLLGGLGMKAIVLGHDSAFGKNREGNLRFLQDRAAKRGFEVHQAPEVSVRGDIISSTRIREAIRSEDLGFVEEMLGRELSLLGKVVPGDGRGKSIGFPTANLDCESATLPPSGVYAVRVLHKGVMRRGVMNLGTRPTFYEGTEGVATTVEVHLPNFEGDLYGSYLEVFIIRKIRDEKRFNTVEELIQAIRDDIATLER